MFRNFSEMYVFFIKTVGIADFVYSMLHTSLWTKLFPGNHFTNSSGIFRPDY